MSDPVKNSEYDQEIPQSQTADIPAAPRGRNSGEILDKLKARGFNATSLSTYDFSTLYTSFTS